jgi:hypothetical protein
MSTPLKAAATHPVTFVALLLTSAAAAGFIYWFGADAERIAVAAGLGGALFLLWLVMFARSDAVRVNISLAATADAAGDLDDLARELKQLGAEQGVAQLQALQEKHDVLADVLKRRMDAGEVTYGRYLGLAQQVFLAAVDGLRECTITLRAASRLDAPYAEKRLKELAGKADAAEEIKALTERLDLGQEQQARLSKLLATNEAALTVLDRASLALASTKTSGGPDATATIKELEALAARTGRYAARLN